MGASQSKLPKPLLQEKLTERLHALEVRDTKVEPEKDYVYVEGKNGVSTSPCEHSPTVSISAAEQWEKELLKDPKVRA